MQHHEPCFWSTTALAVRHIRFVLQGTVRLVGFRQNVKEMVKCAGNCGWVRNERVSTSHSTTGTRFNQRGHVVCVALGIDLCPERMLNEKELHIRSRVVDGVEKISPYMARGLPSSKAGLQLRFSTGCSSTISRSERMMVL